MKSKLLYLNKLAVLFLIFANTVFSQDITNTLGVGGLFKVKDAATDFFILDQSNGTITLPINLANNQLGSIFKGTQRFLHTYYGSGTDGFNTFLGINSGNFSMGGGSNVYQGSYNTGVGYASLNSNTTGSYNTAYGYRSLYSNTTGVYNTANGSDALISNTTGIYNTANGTNALYSNTTGSTNTANGTNALFSNTIGSNNTANGNSALNSNTTGSRNTANGYASLTSNTTGISNTAIGYVSLLSNTTGGNNTALGRSAGSTITTGYNLTCLGFNSQPTSASANNQITLGDGSISELRCNTTTITSLSDARDKKNINDLNLGIEFLMTIKPRQFNWDKREWYESNTSDGSKMKEEPTAGFIAQELDEAQTTGNAEWLNLVLKDNPEKWEATPGNLLPIMVKAIQDLNLKCEELKSENNMLKNNNKKLSAEVESFKSMSEKLITLERTVNKLTYNKQASFSLISKKEK